MIVDRVFPGIAARPIALDHLPIEIARTLLRLRDDLLARFPGQILRARLRHDYATDRHPYREEAAGALANAEAFGALGRQLVESRI